MFPLKEALNLFSEVTSDTIGRRCSRTATKSKEQRLNDETETYPVHDLTSNDIGKDDVFDNIETQILKYTWLTLLLVHL